MNAPHLTGADSARYGRLADRLAILQRLTASLGAARSLQEVADCIIEEVRPALQAEVGVVAVLAAEGQALRNIGFKGVGADTVEQWQEYPLDAPVPMAEAARTRHPVVINTIAERNRRYPVLAEVHGVENGGGVICLPLLVREELLGALGFCFDSERDFDEDERRFLQALADQCALAVERAHWFERAQREIEARASAEQRLRSILESIDDHLVCYDREWRYTYVNDNAARTLGKKKEELLGRSIWELFPNAVGNQYYRELHQAAGERRIIRSEHYYAPFGSWFENRIYPNESGVTVFSSDITWRKNAEQALGEKDRLLSLIQDNASDCLYLCAVEPGERYRIVSVNESFLRVSGFRREHILMQPLESLLPERWPFLKDKYRAVAETATPVVFEDEADLPAGKRYGEVTLVPVVASGGQVTHILGAVKDVTARKQVEAALRDADRRKDEFLAMLAHELRNPLAPLHSGVELIQRAAEEPARVRDVARMMSRQVGHLKHLVDDLLDLSRITVGKVELRKSVMTLAAAVQSAVETSRPALEEAGHRLSMDLGPDGLRVDADPTRLAQVFGNLLNNAARYTGPGGTVRVEVRREGGQALVCVQDTGIGIDPTVLPRVFDMFTQGDARPGVSRAGLGVGLTIAKTMVELHGGTISAFSEGRGRGSRFVVTLPLAEQTAAAPAGAAASPCASGEPPLRVLIADDNADAAATLAELLRLEGKDVRLAGDGKEAIQVAETFRPHVILLDVGMPVMDGAQAARHIRMRPWGRDVILVAVTGWGSQGDVRRCLDAGFDHHFVKPVALEALAAVWPQRTPAVL